jgi:hypothetical protein
MSHAPTASVHEEIERYLRTGRTDPHHAAWSGDFLERAKRADRELREALLAEVARLAHGLEPPSVKATDIVALTRGKVEPMVRGLFPRTEQDVVLALLERSVVFVTADNIDSLIRDNPWDHSVWDLANLYLGSIGAPLLGPEATPLLGLSEDTTCYVSTDYFERDEPFADFIVHEAAHVFHNCKRRTAGLCEMRRREWLLDIEFRKRETFAYSCEAYARVLERARTRSRRGELALAIENEFPIGDDRVDVKEVAAIVGDAATARNGWKVILARCTSRPPSRKASSTA